MNGNKSGDYKMVSEWEVKKEICEIGRRMYINGYVAANDGNISFRMGNGRYLCTPTGVSKGFLKPGDIAGLAVGHAAAAGRFAGNSTAALTADGQGHNS